jgi:hypothetical protein
MTSDGGIRKRLILLLLAVCLVASGCWSSSGRVTKENAAKVKEGMTLPEVIAILGTPGGARVSIGDARHVAFEEYKWTDWDVEVTVIFMDGQVKGAATIEERKPPLTAWRKPSRARATPCRMPYLAGGCSLHPGGGVVVWNAHWTA